MFPPKHTIKVLFIVFGAIACMSFASETSYASEGFTFTEEAQTDGSVILRNVRYMHEGRRRKVVIGTPCHSISCAREYYERYAVPYGWQRRVPQGYALQYAMECGNTFEFNTELMETLCQSFTGLPFKRFNLSRQWFSDTRPAFFNGNGEFLRLKWRTFTHEENAQTLSHLTCGH